MSLTNHFKFSLLLWIVQCFSEIPVEYFYERMQMDVYGGVFDVGSSAQFDCVHINGSISLPLESVFEMLSAGFYSNLRTDPIAIYSQYGTSANIAAGIFQNIFKFVEVETIQGGLNAYIQQGFPIVTSNYFPFYEQKKIEPKQS
eukprot:TRINITY_DN16749_c1_g1_i1.p3 TRINITY_DN16749_c1_g1~~TRINITY_DN16749_c1_g1_i1.p3  ORF type:complete len:144 (+),score=8.53 TRINITY_DN16749_c1_g1_i1:106-537(+)